jgi:hypothetical protein
MKTLIYNRIGLNTPAKVITRRVVQGIAISLLGIVAASGVAHSFTQTISTSIDRLTLQRGDEGGTLVGTAGCRRAAGTRGPCSPPSPWG